jgi:hypothetical protein
MQAEGWSRIACGCALALAAALAAAAPAAAQGTSLFDTIGITRSETRENSQIFGNPPYSLPAEEMPPSRSIGPGPTDGSDDVPLRMPDTSGNFPNLAKFKGQVLTLREEDRKQYAKVHFFGTTTDGGPAGGDFVLRYADDSTQAITVRFNDWCQPQNSPAHHVAIGPLSQRYRTTGGDSAQCAIFHVPANADPGKTLVSVTFPATTTPPGTNTQGYLMALTLEAGDGAFTLPDLSGRVEVPGDDIAPVTTHAFDPPEPNGGDGWYAGGVRVTLNATDEGGAGVDQIQYRIDGGPPRFYAAPALLDEDGMHTLEYRAIDANGNTEEYKAVDLKVDAHAPTTTARQSPSAPLGVGDWYDGAVEVALEAGDGGGSGTAATAYRVDGGAWTDYVGPVRIGAVGGHTLEYRSTDVAGNVEEPRSLAFKIDASPPTTSALVNGAAPVADYHGGARVTFTRSDGDGSGAVLTEYRVSGGDWAPYTGAIDLTARGDYRIDYRSRDLVGNVENYRTLRLSVETIGAAGAAPAARPSVALQPVARRRATVRALRRGRFAVRVRCQGVERGTLRLRVSRAAARRLGLRSRTLATRSVRCAAQGRGTVTLAPRAKVRRALARTERGLTVTLTLRMSGARGADSDRSTIRLRGQGAHR